MLAHFFINITETAVLRECFPKSVVLGPIDRPLRPTTDCNLRDVSEPDAGISGSACLCTTSFCNNKQELQTITGAAPQKTQIITNEVEDPIIEQKSKKIGKKNFWILTNSFYDTQGPS